jgi:hypothetical protein
MPRLARPSPAVEQFLAMLRAGNHLDVAARAAGLKVEWIDRWLERPGLIGNQILKAMAEWEVRGVTQIAQAASTNWQAAAWLLERQYPERWSRPIPRDTDEPAPIPTSDRVDELAEAREARRAQ